MKSTKPPRLPKRTVPVSDRKTNPLATTMEIDVSDIVEELVEDSSSHSASMSG